MCVWAMIDLKTDNRTQTELVGLAIERGRRNTKVPLEHRRERALTRIPMLKRDINDFLSVGQLFQRQEESRVLTPTPECRTCFAMKHAM